MPTTHGNEAATMKKVMKNLGFTASEIDYVMVEKKKESWQSLLILYFMKDKFDKAFSNEEKFSEDALSRLHLMVDMAGGYLKTNGSLDKIEEKMNENYMTNYLAAYFYWGDA